MKTNRILLLSALSALALAGCQDESETATPSQTKSELLQADAWHITGYTRSENGGSAVDYLPTVYPNACERDDRYRFKSTGVVEATEGPTACGSNTSATVVSTYPYTLSADGSTLTYGSIAFEVMRLNADVMQLRHRYTSNNKNYIELIDYAN